MKANCMKCKHFYITYDQATPRGCRVYGIKSKQIPSLVIKSANNGAECIGFEMRKNKQEKEKVDFMDSRMWKA